MGEGAIRLEDGRFIGTQCRPTLEDIPKWRRDFEHGIAIERGWKCWYKYYELKIARVAIAKSFYPNGPTGKHVTSEVAGLSSH